MRNRRLFNSITQCNLVSCSTQTQHSLLTSQCVFYFESWISALEKSCAKRETKTASRILISYPVKAPLPSVPNHSVLWETSRRITRVKRTEVALILEVPQLFDYTFHNNIAGAIKSAFVGCEGTPPQAHLNISSWELIIRIPVILKEEIGLHDFSCIEDLKCFLARYRIRILTCFFFVYTGSHVSYNFYPYFGIIWILFEPTVISISLIRYI